MSQLQYHIQQNRLFRRALCGSFGWLSFLRLAQRCEYPGVSRSQTSVCSTGVCECYLIFSLCTLKRIWHLKPDNTRLVAKERVSIHTKPQKHRSLSLLDLVLNKARNANTVLSTYGENYKSLPSLCNISQERHFHSGEYSEGHWSESDKVHFFSDRTENTTYLTNTCWFFLALCGVDRERRSRYQITS